MLGERVRDGCHPGHPDVRQPVSLLLGHCRRQDWRQGKRGHFYRALPEVIIISTVGTQNRYILFLTVLDLPDPDPLVIGTDPDPFNHKAKIVRKIFISTVL
jgi:hypothetical protein